MVIQMNQLEKEVNAWRDQYELWVIERKELRERAEQAEARLAALAAALEQALIYARDVESGYDKLSEYKPPEWITKAREALAATGRS